MTTERKLQCPNCGAIDGKFIVSVHNDGDIVFRCSACEHVDDSAIYASPVCDIKTLVTMFKRYGML